MTTVLECDLEKDIVTCEVPRGSVLFLNNLVPHRSLNNASDKIRWSYDLRWQRPDEPEGFCTSCVAVTSCGMCDDDGRYRFRGVPTLVSCFVFSPRSVNIFSSFSVFPYLL